MYDSSENILHKNAGPVWLAWLYMLRPLKFFIFSLLSIIGKQVNKLQEKIWFLPAQSFLRRFKDKKMNQREQFIGLKTWETNIDLATVRWH